MGDVCARINAILFGDCVRKGCVGGVSWCVSESSLLALKLSAICFNFGLYVNWLFLWCIFCHYFKIDVSCDFICLTFNVFI